MRNLDVVFDKHLNTRAQVNSICRSAHAHLCNTGRVRSVLSQEATQRLIDAFITPHVDCCKRSPLRSQPVSQGQAAADPEQCRQNPDTLTPKFVHMTPVCRELHWLSASARVDYKILVLSCKALRGLAPQYLRGLLQWYQPGRALRSWHSSLLCVPKTRLRTYGDRAFPLSSTHAVELAAPSRSPGTIPGFVQDQN